MLKLTEYEKGLLAGSEGKGKKKAMEFIVRYANVLGTRELCEVSRATLFIGAQHYLDCYPYNENYKKIFSEFYLCSDEEVDFPDISEDCKAQTCAASCDFRNCEKTHMSKEYQARNLSYINITRKMGVKIVESCTPYYVGWIPMMGEHFVSTESSNVVISNSIFGAMGNSDGVENAVCAAITGRTPKWGMHVKENRYADCLVNIKCKAENMFDWDVIGFTVGRLIPKHVVPVIMGNFRRPDINSFRQFASTISVTSAAEMCHIVGVTPEAQSLEMAVGSKQILHEIDITEAEYEKSVRMIGCEGSGQVDYISIGCPHLALDELKVISEYLGYRKVKDNVELLVWTDYATKEMADVNGYMATIEGAGGYLLTGSCPIVMREDSHKHAKAMAMFGAKQAFGIQHQTKVPVFYGDIFQCIDAAISGEWKGR
ncbi:aconitase X [Cloacibacillus sp.]